MKVLSIWAPRGSAFPLRIPGLEAAGHVLLLSIVAALSGAFSVTVDNTVSALARALALALTQDVIVTQVASNLP